VKGEIPKWSELGQGKKKGGNGKEELEYYNTGRKRLVVTLNAMTGKIRGRERSNGGKRATRQKTQRKKKTSQSKASARCGSMAGGLMQKENLFTMVERTDRRRANKRKSRLEKGVTGESTRRRFDYPVTEKGNRRKLATKRGD